MKTVNQVKPIGHSKQLNKGSLTKHNTVTPNPVLSTNPLSEISSIWNGHMKFIFKPLGPMVQQQKITT